MTIRSRAAALVARLPAWTRTIRVRLAVTYSAVLFAIAALLLVAVYVALSATIPAEPLDPVTVKKFHIEDDGTVEYRVGEAFQAADLESVQRAVNYTSLQTLQHYSLIAVVVLFVLSLGIGWWVAGRALRPVEAITRAAQEITATDLSRRIAADGPRDELRTLADTIDGMLDRLDRAFRDERALVEEVSHELRNPVATIQANVEAVLSQGDTSRERRDEASAVVLRSTARMTRLLEDLLATARRRSEAFTEVDVDLASITEQVAEEYRELAARRGLRIDVSAYPGPVVVADAESLARAVGNLLSNAVRLAPESTTITVGVGSRSGWAWIAVADQGPGIPPGSRSRVFERFHRDIHEGRAPGGTDSSRGSGLGLAIARQIVESHAGRLSLHSRGRDGSTFVIWLPERAATSAPERSAAPPDDDPLVDRVASVG